MVDFQKVRWTLAAVILLLVCVEWAFCRTIYLGGRDREGGVVPHQNQNHLMEDRSHKHLNTLKAPDSNVVDSVKKRLKKRMRGRKTDQSNERNIWRSHPLNDSWKGPDTQEVAELMHSLGI